MSQLQSPAPPPDRDLDDDDRLIGRILSRREVLALFGAGGVALTIAACAPAGSSGAPAATASSGTAAASASPAASAIASPDATVAAACRRVSSFPS